jgi:hypothetical protein
MSEMLQALAAAKYWRAWEVLDQLAPQRLVSSCERILRAALYAGDPGGATYLYFQEKEKQRTEAEARQRFAQLKFGLSFDEKAISQSLELLRLINDMYNATQRFDRFADVNNCLVETMTRISQEGSPIALLDGATHEREQLSKAITHVLACIKRKQQERGEKPYTPYSLVSKFLHFARPDSFVIVDAHAATSIAIWRFFAFECEKRGGCTEAKRFSWETTCKDKTGKGYEHVLEFYQLVWKHASAALRKEAEVVTLEIQNNLIRRQPNAEQARFTVLDLINKLLWQANGNPIFLGLATP